MSEAAVVTSVDRVALGDGSGTVDRFQLEWPAFDLARLVDVWAPPEAGADHPLPVVVAHDGQNVFDPATAYTGIDWGLDEALMRRPSGRRAIAAAVWNNDRRYEELFPPLGRLDTDETGPFPRAVAYGRMLVDDVLPLVAAHYAVRPDAAFLLGSSMGGLASLATLSAYPDRFRGAACLSTHWPAGGRALVEAMVAAAPGPGRHQLWFDHGTLNLDARYAPFQQHADALFTARGWRAGVDYESRVFEGADHNEASWRARLDLPLAFLLD